MKLLRSEDLSYFDRAPIVARASVTIDATPMQIWPALADASAWERWFTGVRTCRYTSEGEPGVGSTRFVHVRSLKVSEEVLAFDPGERFAFRVTEANVGMFRALVEMVTLEPASSGTTVTYHQAAELPRWALPFRRVLQPQLSRSLRKGIEGLRSWVAEHG
ncbi:MAG: SRPBCC family protein [Acidimicrobiales bacterium]|nr:SRPBCC family protein [Acidimicrobiales bacterium]